MRRREKFLMLKILVSVILIFASAGFAIGSGFVRQESVFFVFQNIMSASYVLLGILTVIFLKKHLNMLSISMIIGNCILTFGRLYFIEFRVYLQLLIMLFAVSVGYLAFYLFRFFAIQKRRLEVENTHLTNSVIPVVFIGVNLLLAALNLLKLIITDMDVILTPFVVTGLVAAVIVLTLGVIFIKDRCDKKEYFGKLLGIFFATFLLVFAIPALSIEFANYAFDTSVGEKTQCVVIDKQTRHGGKSGPSYYLVLRADGREIDFNVEKVIYFRYKKGDTIYLYEYAGAFDYHYYEYRLYSIYQYQDE